MCAVGAAHHYGVAAYVSGQPEGFTGLTVGGVGHRLLHVRHSQLDAYLRDLLSQLVVVGRNAVEHLEAVADAVKRAVNSHAGRHGLRDFVVEHRLRRHDGVVYDELLLPCHRVGDVRVLGQVRARARGRLHRDHRDQACLVLFEGLRYQPGSEVGLDLRLPLAQRGEDVCCLHRVDGASSAYGDQAVRLGIEDVCGYAVHIFARGIGCRVRHHPRPGQLNAVPAKGGQY
ncbi:MAG: hypothetical protein BWY85_00936 [Firmicutes bacterium ADurb.Bin506]|nr:MAG: hypothetical protein BWY85_00936 [Firmicutes bacterium ADurb.Bin506]